MQYEEDVYAVKVVTQERERKPGPIFSEKKSVTRWVAPCIMATESPLHALKGDLPYIKVILAKAKDSSLNDEVHQAKFFIVKFKLTMTECEDEQ